MKATTTNLADKTNCEFNNKICNESKKLIGHKLRRYGLEDINDVESEKNVRNTYEENILLCNFNEATDFSKNEENPNMQNMFFSRVLIVSPVNFYKHKLKKNLKSLNYAKLL